MSCHLLGPLSTAAWSFGAAKFKPTIYEIRQALSYMGWISSTNTYRMFKEQIAPYINVQKFKRRISQHDRRKTGGVNYGMV